MSAPRFEPPAPYEHDSFEAKVKRAKTDNSARASTMPQPDDPPAPYEHDSFDAIVKRAKTDNTILASTMPQPDDLESFTQSTSSDKESNESSGQDMVAVGAELTSELHRAQWLVQQCVEGYVWANGSKMEKLIGTISRFRPRKTTLKHRGSGSIANHKQLGCGLISHKHKQRLEETILMWKSLLRNRHEYFMAGEELFAKQEDHNI